MLKYAQQMTTNVDISKKKVCRPGKTHYGEGKSVIIIGAGPGGLLTAVLLAQRGFNVNVGLHSTVSTSNTVNSGMIEILSGRSPASHQKIPPRRPDDDCHILHLQIFEKRPPPYDDEKHHGSRSIVFGLLARGQLGFQKVDQARPEC